MTAKILLLLGAFLVVAACQTPAPEEEFVVTRESVAPASRIDWVGQRTELEGDGELRVGAPLPAIELTNAKMAPEVLASPGKVQVIDTLPSLDTPVCNHQTHVLAETLALDPRVRRVTVSADLPYAQRRFATDAGITGVDFLSDYRAGAFARAAGLRIARNGLLARAVIVVDRDGIVRHLQIVPEITQMPDMEKAFSVANFLVGP
jgi:thiol peroxidase